MSALRQSAITTYPRSDGLEDILRCPITGAELEQLSIQDVCELNSRASRGELRHLDGTAVRTALDAAYATADRSYAYAVCDGITMLLGNLAIALRFEAGQNSALRDEKKSVQDFYERIGWSRGEDDAFIDANKYEDLREVASDYVRRCRLRINDHINPGGRYLLDVASGPIQFPEYLTYSETFDYRICVDLSVAALREARHKLGDLGIYILGDVTNLPFKDGSIDSAISLHTIYHVPRDEQEKAIRELHRVVKSGSQATVIYSWGRRSALMNLLLFPLVLFRAMRSLYQRFNRITGRENRSRLYAYMHPYDWFKSRDWGFELETIAWRTISHHCSMVYAHSWLGGRALLRLAFWFEDRFPSLAGRIGHYPLVIIRK